MSAADANLEAFMARKHNPRWKPRKLGAKPKPVLPRLLKSDNGPGGVGYVYQYHYWNDFRTITEPVSLEEFIARKSDPNFKPKPYPTPPGRKNPTKKDVEYSIRAWNQMVHEHERRTANSKGVSE